MTELSSSKYCQISHFNYAPSHTEQFFIINQPTLGTSLSSSQPDTFHVFFLRSSFLCSISEHHQKNHARLFSKVGEPPGGVPRLALGASRPDPAPRNFKKSLHHILSQLFPPRSDSDRRRSGRRRPFSSSTRGTRPSDTPNSIAVLRPSGG